MLDKKTWYTIKSSNSYFKGLVCMFDSQLIQKVSSIAEGQVMMLDEKTWSTIEVPTYPKHGPYG